ncbi:MAG: SWIM zinc finger family protein, partial [Anaerolineaceae bacterium]|nr:SWIM zinc finger family protein [Anaerolineaceae bacterium]
MKDSGPTLSSTAIQAWVGPASFSKGEAYYFQNAIFEARRQGLNLTARCRGSSAPSYRVQVVLDAKGIASAHCSCPVGGGGHCKHVAALLLTWLEKPGTFQATENINSILTQRNKGELIAIILQMLQHDPDLAYLLEVPSLVSGSAAQSIDPQVIRLQVKGAFSSAGVEWGWRNPVEITADLEGLLRVADRYLEIKDDPNAATIYRVVSEEVMQYKDILMQDDEGSLGWLVNVCISALADCLDVIQTPSERLDILHSLLNIYLADLELGGLFIADEVPGILFDHATSPEKDHLAEWIRPVLPGLDGWAAETLGGLFLELQEGKLQTDEYLEICRQTGRLNDLVGKLLALDRVEEAVSEARTANDYRLLSLATLFVDQGFGSLGEQLILDRTKDSRDSRLWEWLRDHAIAQGDLAKALSLALNLFWNRPSLANFLEIKKIAGQHDQWLNLRSELMTKLRDENRFELLAEIYLDEEEIRLA